MQTLSSFDNLILPSKTRQLHLQSLIKPKVKPMYPYTHQKSSTDKFQVTVAPGKNLQRLDSLPKQGNLERFVQKKTLESSFFKNSFQATFGTYEESPSSSINRPRLFDKNFGLDSLKEGNQRMTSTQAGASKKNYISYLASARALLNDNKENFNLNQGSGLINCFIRDDKFEKSIQVLDPNTFTSYRSQETSSPKKRAHAKKPQFLLCKEKLNPASSITYSHLNQFENVRF